jgi:hypothetical protein
MKMLEELARNLFRLLAGQKTVYVTTEPGLPDFSVHGPGALKISTPAGSMDLPFDRNTIAEVWGMLRLSVFGGEHSVISYGIHPLLSYALFYTQTPFEPPPSLFDLKAIEKFLGLSQGAPADYDEALARMNATKTDKSWVWKQVYRPLMTRVLPDIETTGIIHIPTKATVYTHYEVEHQSQGRMQSFSMGKGFSAHGLGKNPDYKPRGDDMVFVMMDFSAMEVRVLHHLSQCPVLGKIIASGEDVYEGIYQQVFGKACPTAEWRKFVKETFLAVVFGMGAAGLAKSKKIDPKRASNIIHRYYECFPVAFKYVIGQVPPTATTVRDALGRPRWHDANDYTVRNFVIQAPSSTICLERLVALHGAIEGKAKLAMHIHDGYAIVCHKASSSDIYEQAKTVLETESSLMPGLKLKADGKVGPSLSLLVKP